MFRSLIIVLMLVFSPYGFAKKVVDIAHWQTQSGAEVYFTSAPEIPMLDIRVAFDAGSARDEQLFGLAHFTNTLLMQGTKQKNTDEITESFANNGAQYDSYVDRDKAVVALRTLLDNEVLESNIHLLNEILTQANFPKEAFDRVKKQMLASIQERQQSPAQVADDAMFADVFVEHPYAHPIMGDGKSVNQITQKNIQNFYQQFYVGKNATIILVGAIDLEEAKRISEVISQNLPTGKKANKISSAALTQKGKSKKVSVPPNSQMAIRLAQVGINPHDADYFPLLVGNYILGGGGGLNSRLSKEVREKNGLTYSIYSMFDLLQGNGPFAIRFETRTSQTTFALNIALQTLKNFIAFGPNEKELSDAKNYLIGNFPVKLDSNQALVETLLKIGFYHLPLDYLDRYVEHIQAVTGSQVKQVWQKKINPNHLIIITTEHKG